MTHISLDFERINQVGIKFHVYVDFLQSNNPNIAMCKISRTFIENNIERTQTTPNIKFSIDPKNIDINPLKPYVKHFINGLDNKFCKKEISKLYAVIGSIKGIKKEKNHKKLLKQFKKKLMNLLPNFTKELY